MQSYEGFIRLFPGIDGKVTTCFGNLRTEGAFLVSSEMLKGKVTFASITSEKGGLIYDTQRKDFAGTFPS